MLVVIARIKAKEEHVEELETAFRGMVEWVAANEPGTLTYTCNRSSQNPNEYVFLERYTDEQAFQVHSASERFAEFAMSLQGKLDGDLQLEMLEEVAAKV